MLRKISAVLLSVAMLAGTAIGTPVISAASEEHPQAPTPLTDEAPAVTTTDTTGTRL